MQPGRWYEHVYAPRIILALIGLSAAAFVSWWHFGPLPVERKFPGKKWALTPQVFQPVTNAGLSARDCARCHTQHVAEWQLSTHAHALQDLQFQAEIAKESSPKWLCLNCHTPLGNQRESLVRYLNKGDILQPIGEKNPHFDAELKQESITCGTCHFRQNAQGQTLIVTGRLSKAPHPTVVDAPALRGRCLDCHNVTETVNAQLVCSFQTGDELAAGYLAGKKDCVSCHMAGEAQHRHTFVGGGVGKTFALLRQQHKAGYRHALDWRIERFGQSRDRLRVWVSVYNRRAGHRVTSGDPERYLEVTVSALARDGKTLAKSALRIGQTWRWSPVAEKRADNRLLPGERRQLQFDLPLERLPPRLKLVARHVRLTAKNAAYMRHDAKRAEAAYRDKIAQIEKFYPFSRYVHIEEWNLTNQERRVTEKSELDALSAAQVQKPTVLGKH